MSGTNSILHAEVKCYHCNVHGHFRSVCPQLVAQVQMLQTAHRDAGQNGEPYQSNFTFMGHSERDNFLFQQSTAQYNIIPDSWILLDSQSTVSVFKNSNFLTNIRDSPSTLRVFTNGGTQLSTKIGTVANFGDAHHRTISQRGIVHRHLLGEREIVLPHHFGVDQISNSRSHPK